LADDLRRRDAAPSVSGADCAGIGEWLGQIAVTVMPGGKIIPGPM
jgi:hypothetical protein